MAEFKPAQVQMALQQSSAIQRGRMYATTKTLCPNTQLKDCIIKISKSDPSSFPSTLSAELQVLASVNHPFIAPLVGFCLKTMNGSTALVYDLQSFPVRSFSFKDTLEAGTLTTRQAMRILYEVACTLGWLHESQMLHRNLRTDNIICKASSEIAMVDVGIPEFDSPNTSSGRQFDAVQSMRSGGSAKGFSKRTDVFDFGLVLREVLSATFQDTWDYQAQYYLKSLCDMCLHATRQSRPQMAYVVNYLQQLQAYWQ